MGGENEERSMSGNCVVSGGISFKLLTKKCGQLKHTLKNQNLIWFPPSNEA